MEVQVKMNRQKVLVKIAKIRRLIQEEDIKESDLDDIAIILDSLKAVVEKTLKWYQRSSSKCTPM